MGCPGEVSEASARQALGRESKVGCSMGQKPPGPLNFLLMYSLGL